ncbi:hypothetical protein HD554DRAFT_1471906 [Boletus coccyginus]|nr:hypothetical protein HD554DRAFT_1471906 [Boletus coccyginus]
MARVDLVFGPMLIGVFLNCILYGVIAVQTVVYFQTYKGDPRWFKIFVLYLLFCETVNTVCVTGVVYEPLIIRYATLRAVTVAPIMLVADGVVTVSISTPVQIFIAWRVRTMSRSSFFPCVIVFFAITSFVGGIATSVSVALLNEYALFDKFHPAVLTWLGSSAAADVIITASLVYNLMRRRTGFAVTDHLINRVISLTVQTGMITTVFALIDATLPAILTDPTRPMILNFIWDFALSKLYSNSLLFTLNSRAGWKATSSIRDNALFGSVTGGESSARSRTQIEIMTVDRQARRPTSLVPMKVFDSDASYHHDGSNSAINVPQKFADEV